MNPIAAVAGHTCGGPALRNTRDSRHTIRPFERLAIGLVSVALAGGLIAALSGFFAGRDQPALSSSQTGPQAFRDLGHTHLRPGEPRPGYDSNPPTSGAHLPEPVRGQNAALNDDQLLEALELGDVVIMYGGPSPPPGLPALARSVGPFSPALAAVGQAVILAPRPGTSGIVALAWTRMLRVSAPSDPRLRDFAQLWPGKGAHGE